MTLHPRWFVAHTHPHAEAKATAHLNRQGFEIYFPRYLKRRRHARRIETVAAPLFPRYLFVAVDLTAQRWRSIYSTVGVTRLVCNGDDPDRGARRDRRGSEEPRGRRRLHQARLPAAVSRRRQNSRARWRIHVLPRLVRRHGGTRADRDPARSIGPQGSRRAGRGFGRRRLSSPRLRRQVLRLCVRVTSSHPECGSVEFFSFPLQPLLGHPGHPLLDRPPSNGLAENLS